MGELEVRVKTPSITLDFLMKKKTTGQQLLTKVAGLLDLREVRFFGLQFVDCKGTSTWLGPNEALGSQRVRKESPLHFQLGVRFWPLDVSAQVSEETALVLFLRQLQAAVNSGELCCPSSTAAELAAFATQVQYGDLADGCDCQLARYRDSVVPPGTTGSEASRRGLAPEAQAAWGLKVACLHRNIRGLAQRDALQEYFKLAQELPNYGVTYFEVITKLGGELWLGVTARGINVYEDKLTPKLSFSWSSMYGVYCSGRKITIKLERKDTRFVFTTSRKQACMDVMILVNGYFKLQRLQRRANLVSTSRTDQETLSFRTGRLSLGDADRNESTGSRPTSEATTSSASSRPTTSEDGGQSRSVTRSETAVSEDSPGSAAGDDSDTLRLGNREGDTSGVSSQAAAVGGYDESVRRAQAAAAAHDSNDGNNPRPPSDTQEDSEAEGGDPEWNSGAIGFNISSDEESDSDAISAGKRSRRNRFERSLSLSVSENWGPFVQSLMAPD